MRRLIFFLKLFYWFSFRQIARHRFRAVAVLVGIALGAAVFTSVRIAVRASLDAFSRSLDLVAGEADVTVSRPGGRIPETVIPLLLKHSAVGAVSPFSSVYVREDQPGASSFLLVGIDPVMDREFRSWQVSEEDGNTTGGWTDLIVEPFTVFVGLPLAEKNGWAVGDRIPLVHARQTAWFRILGILDTHGLALADGGSIAITDIASFQEFSGTIGRLDRIDVRLNARDRENPVDRLQDALPPGIRAAPASAARESGRGMIQAYQLNLSVLSFASLFVGMFLVYSLVALNAASRRKEIAVLRSLGASDKSVFFLFLAEGGLYGLAGWLLAIPLGGILIPYLITGVGETISNLFVRVVVRGADLSLWEIGFSLVVTALVSLLAALQPAREAMNVSPREAMESLPDEQVARTRHGRLAAGGLVSILMVAPLSGLPGVSGVPIPGYLAMLLLFVGFSLLAPWGIRLLGGRLSFLLRRWGGMPAFLAGRYVRDTGARTAISVGALITAVALYAALVIMIHSFRGTVELWVDQTISGDLFLTTRMAEANQIWEPFPVSDMTALSTLAEESDTDLLASRRFALNYGNLPIQLDFLDLEIFNRHSRFVWLEGDPDRVMPMLSAGAGVIVSEVFANRTGLGAGAVFEAEVDGVRLELPILGIVRDYRTRAGVVFGSLQGLGTHFNGLPWGGVRFFFRSAPPDREAAVSGLRDRIVERFGNRFDMMSGRALREAVLRIFDETFAVTGVLLLIALTVAALGITTTMTVLVLERTRQLNTILAVGGSPGQVRRMIFWETALMIIAGEIAGLLCGFALSYLLVFVINRQSFGWTFLYSVDWGALMFSLPLILLTALGAALPAVRVAFRESPAMLLRER